MLQVLLLSPQEPLFTGQAQRVICPGEQGVFEVAPFHRPLVSRLIAGSIVVDAQAFAIQRGVIKVDRDVVTALIEPDLSVS